VLLDKIQIEEIHWELTNHCNLDCVHCYLAKDARPELNTEKILSIIDELWDAGALLLTFSGGEPLLRKDFSQIYQYAYERGFLLHVFTNGTRISPEIISLFTNFPPQRVEITLNGINENTFEKVTARAGSFSHCMEGIRALNTAGIPLALKTNGMKINYEEVLEIKKFAQSLPNTLYKFDTAVMPRRNHDKAPVQYRLNSFEISKIYENDYEMKEQIEKECEPSSFQAPKERKVFQCSAANSRYHISPWGDLHPCHTVRDIKVSLLNTSFHDAAATLQKITSSLYYPEESKCGSCKLFSKCDSCPGLAHLEQEKALEPAPYHCEVAHDIFSGNSL